MRSPSLGCVVLAVGLGLLAVPGLARAQERAADPGLPPAPVPVAAGDKFPPPPPPPSLGPPPGPPPQSIFAPPPEELLPDVCLPFDRQSAWSGWYTGVDVAVLWPSVDLHFTGDGRLDLDPTAAPRAWLGYRFPQGGSVRLTYWNLDSSGDFLMPLAGGGVQDVTIDLDAHWLDLDYVSRDYVFCGAGRFAWELGGRFTSRDLDAQAADFSGTLRVRTSYFGGGPHAGLRAAWLFGDTGLGMFGRLDGAVTFGEDRGRPDLLLAGPFGPGFALPHEHRSEAEADVALQVGLSWTHSCRSCWLRVAGGAQVEGWGLRRDDPPAFPFRGVAAGGPFLGLELGY